MATWVVRSLSPEARPWTAAVPEGACSIGRASCCLLVCSHQAVSGQHCSLQRTGAMVEIEDGSTNGTWVNGRRLARGERLRLQDGDTVVLSEGAASFSVDLECREAPKKLRKLSLLACEEGCSKAMDQELEASRPPAAQPASIPDLGAANVGLRQDTPLDLDVEMSFGAPPDAERQVEEVQGTLSGSGLLQVLKRRRCQRQGGAPLERRCEGRRQAERYLQGQVMAMEQLEPEALLPCLELPSCLRTYTGRQKVGLVLLLPPTRLSPEPQVAAKATEEWDAIEKTVLSEASKAFTRSRIASRTDVGRALELLQDRVALEPCRRAVMRQLGARPRAGLFGDPAQGSSLAGKALQGVLPAQATGNELRSAAFLGPGLARQLRATLGAWCALPAERPRGWRDLVPCLRGFQEICLGTESHWVGHMMAMGLTGRVAASGGQEHGQCGCGQWVTRQKLKAHHCEHVGKPHLQRFRQSRGILGFQIAYRHLQKQVEITLEAALEPSKLLAMDLWPSEVACSWRLCPTPSESPPSACKAPLISSDELLGWMQSQERERTYTSRQVIREDLCETELCLELALERDRRLQGGLILGLRPGQLAPLLSLLEPPTHTAAGCRVDAPGTLLLVQTSAMSRWKSSLEKMGQKLLVISGHERMRRLAVADVLAAELILAPLQLFATEGYQRHFDSLAKPGLELFEEVPRAEPLWSCGAEVQLHGLQRRELNGLRGRLVEWQPDSERWACVLSSRKVVNVRSANLKLPGRSKKPKVVSKVSKYYAELRGREDYLARRQVDLEREISRLLLAAKSGSSMDLANGPAVLEMFRFGRLVVDDCQLLARDLELLLAEPKVSSYLPKAAPLYAVQAMCAQSRWGIADAECLTSPHALPQIACFLGVQIPYGDSGEAQRFLDAWSVNVEEGAAKLEELKAESGAEIVHRVRLSPAERVARRFQALELDPKSRKAHAVRPGADLAELHEELWTQKCSKDADATLAEEEYNDFGRRLEALRALASSAEGYERELLLACSHADVEELKAGCGLHAQLRRAAGAALEGPHVAGCERCERLSKPRESCNLLKAALARAEKARERSEQRWCQLKALREEVGLEGGSKHEECRIQSMATILETFLSSSPGPCTVLLGAASLGKLEERLKQMGLSSCRKPTELIHLTTEAKHLARAKGHIFIDGSVKVKGRLVHRFVEEP